jgi:methylmalonyl-CoA mutase cobalamin-binding domain/chain
MSGVRHRLRVLLAGPGETAARLARSLRDAGHEVVWSAADSPPDLLAVGAVQEDADVVVLHLPDGAVPDLEDAVADALAARDASDIRVLAGPDVADLATRVAEQARTSGPMPYVTSDGPPSSYRRVATSVRREPDPGGRQPGSPT